MTAPLHAPFLPESEAMMTAIAAIAAVWQAQEHRELSMMRQAARRRLADLDEDVQDWTLLKGLTGERLAAGQAAVTADVEDAKRWWSAQLGERGLAPEQIARLLDAYERGFREGVRDRLFGY